MVWLLWTATGQSERTRRGEEQSELAAWKRQLKDNSCTNVYQHLNIEGTGSTVEGCAPSLKLLSGTD